MRVFFLLSITLIASLRVLSQDGRVPSQKQIQAQMKQAKTQAQQQIIDQENQIAEAEKNGASPEEINELKKNLATMKKMLGVIDKVAAIDGKKKIETLSTTNTVAPYKSPYIKFYTQPVVAPTEAQAKDRLLWYRGKKINKNTLITTSGRVIQYNRQNNQVLVQYNERKDTNTLKIIANLKKSRHWTNNYVNREGAKKNNFFDYPLVMMTMREFDLIEQDYNKLADNTIQLPGSGANLMVFTTPTYLNENRASGPNPINELSIQNLSELDWLEQAHQDILNKMNNPPPLNFPAPPKHEFDLCFYCDTSIQGKYRRAVTQWDDKFDEYEAQLIATTYGIDRQCQLLGIDVNESNIPNLQEDLDKARKFAFKRLHQKIDLLVQQYGNDVYRQEVVIHNILALARNEQLAGYDIDQSRGQTAMETIINLLQQKDFENFFDQRLAANDYNVVFNYAILFGHFRIMQLLGAADPNDNEGDWIEKVQKFNHFALTLNIDFDIQYEPEADKPNLIANGHLSTAQKIYVSLGRTTDCKWQLYKYDPDYGSSATSRQETLFKIPLTVNSGIKKVLKNNQWVTYPYSGPTDLEMNLPIFRISFCLNSGSDSATMDDIRYKQESTEGETANAYTTDLLAYLDKILISAADTKANLNQVSDISDQMLTIQNQATVDNPTGYAKLDEMQVKYKMNGIQHDLQKKATEATRVHTVVLFDAQNGNQFLINGQIDTKHRDMNVIKVNSGLIKIKVVLEPLP